LRVYDAIPLAPALTGVALALSLIAVLLGSEVALQRLTASPADLRLAIVYCLLVAYFPTAYALIILWSRRTVSDLRPAMDCSEAELAELHARVGSYRWWSLAVVGILAVALVAGMTIETTPAPQDPWAWGQMLPEVRWHRVLGLLAGWWAGCFFYALFAESHRLSLLTERLGPIDLLDLRPLMPFSRQALRNALLVLGFVSVYSFFLVEPRFLTMVIGMWIGAVVVAVVIFLLPILGVHRKIGAAKQAELDWCRGALRQARSALRNGASDSRGPQMDEVVAYRQVVDGVREWPFDASTLLRFAIYLLIPLASWSGGAVVERIVDNLLE
jgi:hypothetical protein